MKTIHYLLSNFYGLISLKLPQKIPAVHLLRRNILIGSKTSFLIPERYYEHPRHF